MHSPKEREEPASKVDGLQLGLGHGRHRRRSRRRVVLRATAAAGTSAPASQGCREVEEGIGRAGWVGASWARAGQAAESAAARVRSGGVRGGGRSSHESGRVRGRESKRTYRAMAHHGRLKLQPPKKMKISARSLHFAVAIDVARRSPGRTASQTVGGGGGVCSHWRGCAPDLDG